jgi:predicted AlkP superfamily pyrophosphatase or phosphodiesterase
MIMKESIAISNMSEMSRSQNTISRCIAVLHLRSVLSASIALALIVYSAQLKAQGTGSPDRPKLMVGIVVDQMRLEYLYRFSPKFGNDGFRRLVNDGFLLKNAHYNYAPTVTGPGHASVYTGTTPALHGIIGNEFYDKQLRKTVNCVGDPLYDAAGESSPAGDVSPWRMLSSTVTDELKLFTNKQSKVIGISIKDRGAVLPAGHAADAAYWYDNTKGKFITSTYYMKSPPAWVTQFNAKNLPDIYLSQVWKPLLPVEQYKESGPDQSPYETKIQGKTTSTVPYDLKALRANSGDYDLLTVTPFANDYVTEFAKTALTAEKLGKDAITDFLCLSYSSTDILGHSVGPRAVELEDMYLRLDRNIADLLKKLDQEVGAGNYSVFLTADHAVADVPQYLKDNGVPAGYFSDERAMSMLKEFLASYFPGKDLVAAVSNGQIFLNQDAFQGAPKTSGLDLFIVSELAGKFMLSLDGVSNYYTEGLLRQGRYDEEGHKGMIIRGYHQKRSGDVVFTLEPGWLVSSSPTGTTHGSAYTYDTSVPVIFYGKNIRKGSSVRRHAITDIAPTISVLLGIPFPNSCTGNPVEELFE